MKGIQFICTATLCGSLVSLGFGGRFLPQVAAQQNGGSSSTVVVPAKPERPLFEGKAGVQRSEIEFVPLTRVVTMKIHVEDPNGYFLPNLRRENFAVYEDGVRQKNVTVEIEHAPVTVALLVELGGRYHELNKSLGLEIPVIGRQLLEVIGRNDRIAVFKYDEKLVPLADFDPGPASLDKVFNELKPPESSEANFYDALMETLNLVRDLPGRKAIIVASSGLDTFSKTTFDQLLRAVQNSDTAIYTIGLVHMMQREAAIYGSAAPFARIDWQAAEKNLETLARTSGGRAYVLQSDVDIPGIYDDLMENLRIRYVITYVSSNPTTVGPPRNIRVELIDPKTGQALKIRDTAGKPVAAKIFLQETYTPRAAAGG